jgi:hypothetical protein
LAFTFLVFEFLFEVEHLVEPFEVVSVDEVVVAGHSQERETVLVGFGAVVLESRGEDVDGFVGEFLLKRHGIQNFALGSDSCGSSHGLYQTFVAFEIDGNQIEFCHFDEGVDLSFAEETGKFDFLEFLVGFYQSLEAVVVAVSEKIEDEGFKQYEHKQEDETDGVGYNIWNGEHVVEALGTGGEERAEAVLVACHHGGFGEQEGSQSEVDEQCA